MHMLHGWLVLHVCLSGGGKLPFSLLLSQTLTKGHPTHFIKALSTLANQCQTVYIDAGVGKANMQLKILIFLLLLQS